MGFLDFLSKSIDVRGLPNIGPAPDIVEVSKWINSKPMHIQNLKGKVVLIQFWTYGCGNCVNTLSNMNAVYAKYKSKGLVVIGVHSPEFSSERDISRVEFEVKRYDIKYPIAVDNDHATWDLYNTRYWPSQYLIDKEGSIRYTHIGEGDYLEIEEAIKYLLDDTGKLQ